MRTDDVTDLSTISFVFSLRRERIGEWEQSDRRKPESDEKTMPEPLNLPLYQVLQARFRRVKVVNQGQRRLARQIPDATRPRKQRTEVTQRGEQYAIDCPFCGGSRQRLYVSYLYGIRDRVSGSSNFGLLYCHNEKCHERQANRDRFRDMVALPPGRRARQEGGVATRVALAASSPPPAMTLPADRTPLSGLTDTHPAITYLQERRFDPLDLWSVWEVCHVSGWSPVAANRIVFPLHCLSPAFWVPGQGEPPRIVLAGWQARVIGPAPSGVPKYLFPAGMQKSSLLYGLPQALHTAGPVYLCEGPTDVWRVGPGAVAVFGHDLSEQQKLLAVHYFAGRPIVILPDQDAIDAGRQIQRKLTLARAIDHGDNRVVVAALPPGREDPADCTREELVAASTAALGLPSDPPGLCAQPQCGEP